MTSNPSNYLQINSKFRSNPADNSNDCRIDLADNLKKGTWRLVYFLFPNTISSVNTNNNKISVQLKNSEEIESSQVTHRALTLARISVSHL